MDIRSQIAMVFHLDKCIGCHTCSVACKNIWTDRKGAEYMWWNNVETKPGTGYPGKWEDQEIYKGGWKKKGDELKLASYDKKGTLLSLFSNPNMPVIEDYYEPFTYDYQHLTNALAGEDQPTARPISMITGKPMDIKMGPAWDDDLGGTPDFARQDSNLKDMTEEEKESIFQIERMMMFYLPRICNHCLNPACVAACPSGAIYKRGEDGIVLLNQEKCRAWRMCVTSCPYKKSYYNWSAGKSEKCLLCYPRLETGQAPACMHTCVGRIRYLGVLLYDADKIKEYALAEEHQLVDKQKELYLNPFDPEIIRMAKENGIADSTIESAQKSPVWKFLMEWNIALPLHPEYRTLPNLFYVPPVLPIIGMMENGHYNTHSASFFGNVDETRLPLKYLANLFSAGDTSKIAEILKKLYAVRLHRRNATVGDLDNEMVNKAMQEVNLSHEEADSIFRLTSLPKWEDRFVIPPAHREQAIEMLEDVHEYKGNHGIGFNEKPKRIN
ncbi:MAG: nitrate reductase subunit beta [Sphingobacteriales bacterium]|nr:nitrate reductase subunit beta [Sphingobacteriales bacterium]